MLEPSTPLAFMTGWLSLSPATVTAKLAKGRLPSWIPGGAAGPSYSPSQAARSPRGRGEG